LLSKYVEIATKDTRYAYTTGRVRALELYLLKEADFIRIRQSGRIKEVLQILNKIFPYSESMKDIQKEEEFERGLDRELKRTYEEVRYFCPQPELIDLFWLDNDFYNLKVLLKTHFQERVFSGNSLFLRPPLSEAGTLDLTLLEESIAKEDFSELVPGVRDILQEIFSSMGNSHSLRFIDDFLNRQFFQWLVLEMKKYPDPFLARLIQLQIDSFNIKAFFRLKLFWGETAPPEEIFAEGGIISKQQLLRMISEPLETLEEELRNTDYGEAIRLALEEQKKESSLFSLHKFFDQYILEHTYCGFYITLGREPLVNYIFLRKQEIKHLRAILGPIRYTLSSRE
jgi:V/A-type H+-transporting ATPase subunit C